jgi:hypothetical protein
LKTHYAVLYHFVSIINDAMVLENMEKVLRLEVFADVTMKNIVFWDVNTQFLPNRRYNISAIETSR